MSVVELNKQSIALHVQHRVGCVADKAPIELIK
jgi:hypothetical protein